MRTRAAILDVAWELIAEKGLGVGMAEIAERVGMTRQSVYVHFRTRGGLLMALVRRADERESIHARFEAALESPDAAQRLDSFLRVWFAFVPRIHPVARQLIAAAQHDAAAAEAWNDRMQELHAGFLLLTRSLRRDGRLAADWTAPRAADYLLATTSVPTWERLAVDRAWGAGRTSRTLRRTASQVLLRT